VLLVGAVLLAIFVVGAPWSYVLVGAAVVAEVAETGFWIWLSKRRRVQVGAETLVGEAAEVVTPCLPDGQVRIQGELWQARCPEGAGVGAKVRVTALDGLTLVVERAGSTSSSSAADLSGR
jgi:membrane-bound serine protease (ClpP class)